MDKIIEMLDELIALRDTRDGLVADVDAKIALLTVERNGLTALVDGLIADVTQNIKSATIENGATVKAARLQAVYNKPCISWDTKGLDGYAVAHPELGTFRKEGKPSVSIRGVK